MNNVKGFDKSKMEEIEGLLKRATFKLVNVHDIVEGTRIFWSRFVDTFRYDNSDVTYKRWLVPQNFKKCDAAMITTKVYTVQRVIQRIVKEYVGSIDQA